MPLVTAKKGGSSKTSWVGARVGAHSEQNKRPKQEDAYCVVDKAEAQGGHKGLFGRSSGGDKSACLFAAVFDGHGGETVSKVLAAELHRTVLAQEGFSEDVAAALKHGFLEFNRHLLQSCAAQLLQEQTLGKSRLVRTKGDRDMDLSKAGSTACVATLQPGAAKRRLTVAWVGDSRAVLSRGGRAVPVSEDHKAARKDETARVRAANGHVNRNGQVNNSLAVSRSFGDIMHVGHELTRLVAMKPAGKSPEDDKMLSSGIVIALPDVEELDVEPEDEFLIIASDGLWDSFSNQEAVNFVRQQLAAHGDVQLAAKAIVDKSLTRVADNVTVLVLALRC
jgi:serine/threonine protein phosphatase PrpC